jgi:septum formation protein
MIFILASKSPRRIKLLKENGYKFKIIPSNISEKSDYKRPDLLVKDLAYKKALSVAQKYPSSVILAADTVVYCCKKIIGKPKNSDDALRLLRLQSGRWQSVYTGVAFICLKKNIFLCDYEKSRCYMKKMTTERLKDIASKHLDKAGGWAVQDKNDYLITKIKGRYDNIVGLPMNLVNKFFKEFQKVNR